MDYMKFSVELYDMLDGLFDKCRIRHSVGCVKNVRLKVAAISIAALLCGCDLGCENEISRSITSPSGELKVVVFHRGCGATTGFNTQVSVLKVTASLPNEGGNVLVIEGKVPLQIKWSSEGNLSVSGLSSEKVFKREPSVSGVAISYQ